MQGNLSVVWTGAANLWTLCRTLSFLRMQSCDSSFVSTLFQTAAESQCITYRNPHLALLLLHLTQQGGIVCPQVRFEDEWGRNDVVETLSATTFSLTPSSGHAASKSQQQTV